MKEITKPKLGAALFISDWFLTTVGIDGSTNEEYAALGRLLDEDVVKIQNTLRLYFDPVFPGVISTVAEAEAAAKKINEEDPDAILIMHVMWGSDYPLIKIFEECAGYPVLLWYYNPFSKLPGQMTMNDLFRSSGSVGILQGSAPMSRLGVDFEFCFGTPDSESLRKTLSDYSRALGLKRDLKSCRIAQIGPRCEYMTGTFTDEAKLLRAFGAEVVQLPVERLAKEANSVPEKRIIEFVSGLKQNHRIIDVDDDSLFAAAKASLGVEKLVIDEAFDIVSIEDLDSDLHSMLRTRPCLWTDELTKRGTAVVMERDTVSGLGMYICSYLLGGPCMYGEIFTSDIEENAILFGHAGMHNTRLADGDIKIIKDMEYYQADETSGAWEKFNLRPGDVTLVSMYSSSEGYRIVSFKGHISAGPDRMPMGFPNAYIKCDKDPGYLYKSLVTYGMTQHFSLCYGDVDERLRIFCKLTGIEYVEL